MAIFGLGKKKEKKEQPAACCSCGGSCCESQQPASDSGAAQQASHHIKVLGSGCKTCHAQYDQVNEAAQHLNFDAAVEYVTDLQKVMAYGTMQMPAIVIDEKVVAMGRLVKAAEVEQMLQNL